MGISRNAVSGGLDRLEEAGLIRVDRHNGRCPVITLLDYIPVQEESDGCGLPTDCNAA